MSKTDERIERIKKRLLEIASLNKGMIGCGGSNPSSDFLYEIVSNCFNTAAEIVEKTK